MASNNKSSGLGISGIVFIVFLILKLTNNIDWSWWWVCSPLWIPLALAFSFIVILFLVLLVLLLFGFQIHDLKTKFEALVKTLKEK